MFEYVQLFIDQFIEYLPEIAIFCIVLAIIGNLVFRRR